MCVLEEGASYMVGSVCFLFLHISQLHAWWCAVVLKGVASFFYQHILSITLTKSFVEWKQWYYIFLFISPMMVLYFMGEKEKRCDVMRLVPQKDYAVYNLCIYKWLEEGLFIVGLVLFFISHPWSENNPQLSPIKNKPDISRPILIHNTKAVYQWRAHNSSLNLDI